MNIKELLEEDAKIYMDNLDIRCLTTFERLKIILKIKELEVLNNINNNIKKGVKNVNNSTNG